MHGTTWIYLIETDSRGRHQLLSFGTLHSCEIERTIKRSKGYVDLSKASISQPATVPGGNGGEIRCDGLFAGGLLCQD